jgi:PAS domain S-box-containing protein
MAEMMGYSVEESIGMSFASVIHPTELERIINRFQNRMKGLVEPNRYESVFIRHDGEKMPVEISARLIEWQGQRATMAYCTDLTERKRLEDEVLKISQWEKQRIGHDLHDALGQQLTGIAYLSKDLESDLTDESSAHVAKAARLGFLLRTAIELVRRVVRGLTPVEMDEGGLPAGLSRLANEAQTTMGIECRFDNGVKTPIRNLEAASHLYHIAQEALTNAVRHGGARNVTIRLFEDGSQGELVVEDDGTGLLPCDGQQDGSGLKIMRYRVNRVGGKLSLTSNGKAGLAVHCTFDMGLAGLIDTLGDRNGSA